MYKTGIELLALLNSWSTAVCPYCTYSLVFPLPVCKFHFDHNLHHSRCRFDSETNKFLLKFLDYIAHIIRPSYSNWCIASAFRSRYLEIPAEQVRFVLLLAGTWIIQRPHAVDAGRPTGDLRLQIKARQRHRRQCTVHRAVLKSAQVGIAEERWWGPSGRVYRFRL